MKRLFHLRILMKLKLKKAILDKIYLYLISLTPSVVTTWDAGVEIGYTGFRVRGSDPTRINVTVNGIPLNDSKAKGFG